MVYALTWMPEVLEKAGLKVAEVPGWRTRGVTEMGLVRGVMVHHTAGAAKGNMPTLDLLIKGRPDLAGPLAQLGLGRDGTFYVIAAGKCNHAGKGAWKGVTTGNTSFIGIEAENCGTPADIWPDIQLDALQRGVAALLAFAKTDSTMVCGHREYALPAGRKNDPLFSMSEFRERVAGLLAAGVPPAPLIPARDAASRPTLRRGAEGPMVKELQAHLGVETLGIFGPKTEAAVRELQRQHGLVPDGIVGPRSWALIDTLPGSTAASATPASTVAAGTATTDAAIIVTATARTAAPQVSAPSVATIPPPDDATHPVKVNGRNALTPDGKPFVTQFKRGWVTNGDTSVRAALAADPAAAAGVDPSRLAIVSTVSSNEGRLEAVNSWDGAFLSFGILQWTVAAGGDAGELAALLAHARTDDAAAFADCFGRFGVDVAIGPGAITGHLLLSGTKLASEDAKAVLRKPEWAYRFWRAGAHPAIRRSQIRHAVARFDRFTGLGISGHTLSDWLSSELGMAMLFDQHVNRPGHVPATLGKAVTELLAARTVPADPAQWDEAAEHKLIDLYLDHRAQTSMTDSDARAKRLFKAAQDGLLQSGRGTFR
jgi:hypothetical protein